MKVSDYLPGYENGVFVSYAHLDKEWVDVFVARLSASLKRLIGVEETGLIWKDDRLWVGERLSDELADAIGSSAIFLIVLTPGWINSAYCHAELTHFESRLRDPENQRICIVEALPPTEGQALPPALMRHFSNHVHVKFYLSEPDSGGFEAFDNPSRKPYAKALSAVACSLREGLTAVRRGQEAAKEARRLPPVVLAEATDDLADRREEVRAFLEGAGVDVLPLGSYFTRLDGFERAFGSDIGAAALLVQLLGRYAGRTLPGSREPFVTLQHRLAMERRLPILQWRPAGLDLQEVTMAEMRALLEGATVRGGTLESFKQEVLRALESLGGPAIVKPEALGALAAGSSHSRPERVFSSTWTRNGRESPHPTRSAVPRSDATVASGRVGLLSMGGSPGHASLEGTTGVRQP